MSQGRGRVNSQAVREAVGRWSESVERWMSQ